MQNKYDRDTPRSPDYDKDNYYVQENEDNPPTGKIKEVGEKLKKYYKLLDRPYCSTICTSHLLQGVRTNGNHRRSGLSRLLSEAAAYIAGLKSSIKALEELQPVAQEVQDIILESFTLCPECQGACGERLGPNW